MIILYLVTLIVTLLNCTCNHHIVTRVATLLSKTID